MSSRRIRDIPGREWPTRKKPLRFTIDGSEVSAWPAFVPREHPRWKQTYISPATGERVLAVEGPRWMFETPARHPTTHGDVRVDQTEDDVRQLAIEWLHTEE